ncbi:hypothetical protein [Vulcanisaeta sp. JCM 16159]|uniref:hypothetical protein n=1 Tax=Vulcanisaeta sp. JCM 16159 TaxID=1295371 RepID=UPI0006D1F2AB|nr:hypothetical protein [Vulcanisaeta sp. JCM 16159]
MPTPKPIDELPYKIKVYINNQVLIPAKLVKALGLEQAKYVDIIMRYDEKGVIELRNVRLLRAKNTASRQFTIPRDIRIKYGIKPLDSIEILTIIPKQVKEELKSGYKHEG